MNILVLNYEYPPLGGGAAPVSKGLSDGMAEAGHKVTVLTMGFPGLPAEEEDHGVRIIRLKCLRKHAHSCMPWEQFSYIVSAIAFLREHLKTYQYDVCHAHFVVPTGPVACWLRQYAGIPYILTAHGSDVEGHNKRTYIRVLHLFLRPFWKQAVGSASAVTAPTAYLIGLMRKHYKGDKYVLIPNGIDIEKYRSDPGKKEKRILLMGRLQKSKGFQTVLKAVSRIPWECWGTWHVDILGDGPYRADLEKMAGDLHIRERVTFHGWIDNGSPEQMEFIKKSAVFVSASQFENCPLTVLEAVAAGCCPLLSDIEGHRQFFQNKDDPDRFFFPAGAEEILSDRLSGLLRADTGDLFTRADLSAYEKSAVVRVYIGLFLNVVGKKDV